MIVATIAGDVAALISALATLLLVVLALWNRRTLVTVHNEVKTQNGLTMAALADRAEGRRIESDVPRGDRTSSEQHYVEKLNQPTEGA